MISDLEIGPTSDKVLIEKGVNSFGPLISILIPAHNEERTLESVLDRTESVIKSLGAPYEIIIIDDGSTDQTRDIISKRNIVFLRNHKNCGKGHALRTGFKYCKGNIIVTMDADGSHQAEELPRLIQPIIKEECSVVIGSRFKGYIEQGAMKKTNFIGNMFFNFLMFLFTGKLLTDTQSGFRAFQRNVLFSLNLSSDGYDIETEMTAQLLKNRFHVKEVPIYCTKPQRKSGLEVFADGLKILKTIFRVFLKRRRGSSSGR